MTVDRYYHAFERKSIETQDGVIINTYVGGSGDEAVLLLHGHPETCLIWRDVAPELGKDYRIVLTDLRGYGDSSKPEGEKDHSTYSKRAMANDQLRVMEHLGIERFHVVGHDRGARVAYRLVKDNPQSVISCTMMDILPANRMYADTERIFAEKYWHWFFYIQDEPLPERLLEANPELFIRTNLQKKVSESGRMRFPDDVIEAYIRSFSDPKSIHAICEDYRASATVDRVMDEADEKERITTPLLALWGANGVVGKLWDVLSCWREYACNVEGFAVENCGHFVPEEQPEIVTAALRRFISKHEGCV